MVDLLIRLDRNIFDIKVICSGQGALTNVLAEHNIPVINLPELKREINILFDTIAFLKLIAIFKKFKFDIVHTHSSKPGFLGRLAAKMAGVPAIIHTVHGFAFHQYSSRISLRIYRLFERIAGLAADKVILLNRDDFEYAKAKKIVNNKKIVKIHNGVCLEDFDYKIDINQKKKSLDIKKDDFIIGFVARLWEQKAPDDFIAAIPIVLEKIPNVLFLIIGDGHLRSSLESQAQKLQVQNQIRFLGWRNDVPEIVQILDVFVQTSLWEGLSLSILEAMAAGKPVIATDIKGNNELVVDGITGFLVPPRMPEMVGSCITTLLNDKKLIKKMGNFGRKRVEEKFDIKLQVERTKNIYHEIFAV